VQNTLLMHEHEDEVAWWMMDEDEVDDFLRSFFLWSIYSYVVVVVKLLGLVMGECLIEATTCVPFAGVIQVQNMSHRYDHCRSGTYPYEEFSSANILL